MNERDWKPLLFSIARGRCIVLLGPEISSGADASESITAALRRELAEGLETPLPDGTPLAAAAQQYAFDNGRSGLEDQVVQFYGTRRDNVSATHDALAALPFSLFISSCHDSLMEGALERAGKRPAVGRYNYRGDNTELDGMGAVARPLVYHLYGATEEPESLVLTENDLLDFLVAVVSQKPPLPKSLCGELAKQSRSFLFLGFGIKHWYLRILLHVLKFNQSDNRSFALEDFGQEAPPRQTILFYKRGYRIDVVDMDSQAFLAELRRRYDASDGLRAREGREVNEPAVRAKVFISYAKEDGATAEKLYAALDAGGLEPWMDKARLAGGEVWDQAIADAVDEADYFLVLQSAALARKSFSYVNKEINLALDRQKLARRGGRFIIPVQIDGEPLLADFTDLQAVPFHSGDDVGALTSIIKRDFQLRTRKLGA